MGDIKVFDKNGERENIRCILTLTKKIMDEHMGGDIGSDILIEIDPDIECPIILYDRGTKNEYKMNLKVTREPWDQLIFQFAHEYCHLRTNYSQSRFERKFKWFEESVAETASLYFLKQTYQHWLIAPPVSYIKPYPAAIMEYANNRIAEFKKGTPANFQNWFSENLPILTQIGNDRNKNGIIAITILPLFDAKLWEATTYLNMWEIGANSNFHEYCKSWRMTVPEHLSSKLEILFELLKI
jgi:hypothetical protein